jgi:catechol 2,3-dioxygenase-like lactoylglutathione lyase family enzyme
MTVPARVNLVTLGVTDLDRATAFYTALGWRLSGSSVPGEVSFFDLTNCVLAVWGYQSLAEDALAEAGEPPAFRGVATAINVGSEGEVDAVISAAAAAGGRVAKAARKADWGGYSGYFADPEGHLWEVAHNPYWPLDEKGSVRLPE